MAIAGACVLTGDSVTPPDIARSLAAMTLDPVASQPCATRQPCVGVVFGGCDQAQIAEDVAQPARLLALFDGRLDDRAGLVRALGGDHRAAASTDAALALQAYARWREDFPAHLIGDFACAIWDGSARRLLLARDAFGARPLFFWRGAGLIFATEPRGLLAQPQIPKAVDERWVARTLSLLPQNDSSSFYKGIERVMPGHVLSADAHGVRQLRHWRPENLAPIRFARDEDYAEGLRAALDEAIRCRIGTSAAIGSHLSAGLDSSSVTALAARQLAARGRRLTAFTAVPGAGADPSQYPHAIIDEGPLAALTAAALPNVDHVLIPNLSGSVFDAMDRASLAHAAPIFNPFNQVWMDAIGDAARRRGIGVLLTGQTGNMTISYNGAGWLAQLVRQGHWGRLFRELAALHRRGGRWLGLINQHVVSQLPTTLRRPLRAAARHPERALGDFSAIRPEFAARLGVVEEAREIGGNMLHTALGRRDVRLAVMQRIDPAMFGRAVKRMVGIDILDPTADRRLVEFCLAIPPDQFLRHGEPRALIRRAMAGILPDPVLRERRKGLQAVDWHVGSTAVRGEIAAEIERLERSPLASDALDLPRLRRLVENWPSGGWHRAEISVAYGAALARGIATGRFIRQVEGGEA